MKTWRYFARYVTDSISGNFTNSRIIQHSFGYSRTVHEASRTSSVEDKPIPSKMLSGDFGARLSDVLGRILKRLFIVFTRDLRCMQLALPEV